MEEGQGRRDSKTERDKRLQAEGSGEGEGPPLGAEGQDREGDPARRKAPDKNRRRGGCISASAVPTREGKERAGRPTGPRTLRGKNRSKHNALTHGIFADVVLEDRESVKEFRKLITLIGARYDPGDALVEILVGELGMILWKKRRLLRAEKDQLQRFSSLEDMGASTREHDEAAEWVHSAEAVRTGFIRKRNNLFVVVACLRLLRLLRNSVETRGFKPEDDQRVLRFVYGERGSFIAPVAATYEECQSASASASADKTSEAPSSQTEVQRFLQQVDAEIGCLELETKRNEMKMLAREYQASLPLIPRREAAELLLRYWSMLERSFERTLTQLEVLSAKER